MRTKTSFLTGAMASALMISAFAVVAQEETQPAVINNDGVGFSRKDGDAVIVYDPVAAFDQHMIQVADCSAHKVDLQGVSWCFASAENAESFKAATTDSGHNQYIPFGGGHCALGLAFNNLAARGDPRTAVRIGDNLVLNGNFDVRARFLTDTETNMSNALSNFQTGLSEGKLVN